MLNVRILDDTGSEPWRDENIDILFIPRLIDATVLARASPWVCFIVMKGTVPCHAPHNVYKLDDPVLGDINTLIYKERPYEPEYSRWYANSKVK